MRRGVSGRVPGVAERDLPHVGLTGTDAEGAGEVSRLDRSAVAGGEDEPVLFLPEVTGFVPVGLLLAVALTEGGKAEIGQRQEVLGVRRFRLPVQDVAGPLELVVDVEPPASKSMDSR